MRSRRRGRGVYRLWFALAVGVLAAAALFLALQYLHDAVATTQPVPADSIRELGHGHTDVRTTDTSRNSVDSNQTDNNSAREDPEHLTKGAVRVTSSTGLLLPWIEFRSERSAEWTRVLLDGDQWFVRPPGAILHVRAPAHVEADCSDVGNTCTLEPNASITVDFTSAGISAVDSFRISGIFDGAEDLRQTVTGISLAGIVGSSVVLAIDADRFLSVLNLGAELQFELSLRSRRALVVHWRPSPGMRVVELAPSAVLEEAATASLWLDIDGTSRSVEGALTCRLVTAAIDSAIVQTRNWGRIEIIGEPALDLTQDVPRDSVAVVFERVPLGSRCCVGAVDGHSYGRADFVFDGSRVHVGLMPRPSLRGSVRGERNRELDSVALKLDFGQPADRSLAAWNVSRTLTLGSGGLLSLQLAGEVPLNPLVTFPIPKLAQLTVGSVGYKSEIRSIAWGSESQIDVGVILLKRDEPDIVLMPNRDHMRGPWRAVVAPGNTKEVLVASSEDGEGVVSLWLEAGIELATGTRIVVVREWPSEVVMFQCGVDGVCFETHVADFQVNVLGMESLAAGEQVELAWSIGELKFAVGRFDLADSAAGSLRITFKAPADGVKCVLRIIGSSGVATDRAMQDILPGESRISL